MKNLKNLEKDIINYKNRINILNKLIKQYEEREKIFSEKENKSNKNNSKEEGVEPAPCLREDSLVHSCSSSTKAKVTESFKKGPSATKEIKYISPVVYQKIKSRKILRKTHTMNNYSTVNSRRNDSLTKTRNNEDVRSTIDAEKYNNSTIFIKKNTSLYAFTMKNNIQKKKIKVSSKNKNRESSTNSYLNNSQLSQNKNIKLYDKLDVYKKILNKKITNISRKKKNNGFQSYRNNSVFISSLREKGNHHSHSLENEFYSAYQKRPKDWTDKLKGITIKVIQGKNKNKIEGKNVTYYMKQKILNKNLEAFSVNHLINESKNKKILLNNLKDNAASKLDNDSSEKYIFLNKVDKDKFDNKILPNSKKNNYNKKS